MARDDTCGQAGSGTAISMPSQPLAEGRIWTEGLPAQRRRDLGFNIFLRLGINERINFLFVRELLIIES